MDAEARLSVFLCFRLSFVCRCHNLMAQQLEDYRPAQEKARGGSYRSPSRVGRRAAAAWLAGRRCCQAANMVASRTIWKCRKFSSRRSICGLPPSGLASHHRVGEGANPRRD